MTREDFSKPYLIALYYKNREQSHIGLTVNQLIDEFDLPRDDYLEKEVLEYLNFQSLVKSPPGTFGVNDPLVITPHGKATAERWIADGIDALRRSSTSEQTSSLDRGNALRPRDGSLHIVEDFDILISQVAPASDRMVTLGDNADLSKRLMDGVGEISQKISTSNTLPTDEKLDVEESLGLFQRLVRNSKTMLVGAFRYLVLERIKKAFEKAIEDAFKAAILFVLAGLVALILAVL